MKGKETKLYNLKKVIRNLEEDQKIEQEEERKKLQNDQNQLKQDKKKHADEEMLFFRQKIEQEEGRKKLQNDQNQLKQDKKKHADEEMLFLRQKVHHARMMKRDKANMKKDIEEMKKEKEAHKIRQKNFIANVKKYAYKEKRFGVSKECKSKKELDLEEREQIVLLKENEHRTLSRQLSMKMAVSEEKEKVHERKILDKEAEFKIKSENLSTKELRFASAEVQLTKEKKDVAAQKKKYDFMLSLLKTKEVTI